MENKKNCANCNKIFTKTISTNPYQARNYDERWLNRKYCTPICARQAGLKKSWKDNHDSRVESLKAIWKDPQKVAAMKPKMTALNTGKESPFWKGEDATYNSKHRWIHRHWQRTEVCDSCGITPPPRRNGHSGTEWANISGNYLRDRDDWYELCSKCHKFFDKTKGNA